MSAPLYRWGIYCIINNAKWNRIRVLLCIYWTLLCRLHNSYRRIRLGDWAVQSSPKNPFKSPWIWDRGTVSYSKWLHKGRWQRSPPPTALAFVSCWTTSLSVEMNTPPLMSQHKCCSNDGTDQYTSFAVSVCSCGHVFTDVHAINSLHWMGDCMLSDKSIVLDTSQGDKWGLILSPLLNLPSDTQEYTERLRPKERDYMYFSSSLHLEFVLWSQLKPFIPVPVLRLC